MIQLFNADCLEKMKDISSNSIDVILCDLPFGCLGADRRSEKVKQQTPEGGTFGACEWDIKIDLEAFWKEVRRIRKNEHSPTIHFCTTKYGFDLYNSNPKEFRYDLVWDKGRGVSFLSANKMPMRSHEMMYVFSKAGATYQRVDISGEPYTTTGNSGSKVYGKDWNQKHEAKQISTRCVLSVIHNPTGGGKGKHPTEKPIELYKFLIERYCPVGGTVLDPTFGSCNSGRAARELKRNYIGIEKDKTFFDKAKKSMVE
jgi:site-specific DNA-methyltransferase (adenine-specific)